MLIAALTAINLQPTDISDTNCVRDAYSSTFCCITSIVWLTNFSYTLLSFCSSIGHLIGCATVPAFGPTNIWHMHLIFLNILCNNDDNDNDNSKTQMEQSSLSCFVHQQRDHIFINDKGYTTGWRNSQNTWNQTFIKSFHSFIPETATKLWTCSKHKWSKLKTSASARSISHHTALRNIALSDTSLEPSFICEYFFRRSHVRIWNR